MPRIIVNEFYRGGNLNTTDEWIELLLVDDLTAAELETFFVGDSTGTTTAKFSGYQFTNMAGIAANFPAGTVIVVGGDAALTQDTSYNPGGGDWNILLNTNGGNLTSNGSNGDLAGADVVYVDTNGTNGDATISADGFAVNYSGTPGAFGAAANVTIPGTGNNTAVALTSDQAGATTPGNWTINIALGAATLGDPNGGANTTFVTGLRGGAPAVPAVIASEDFDGGAVNLINGFDPATGNLDGGPGDFFGVASINAWPQAAGVPFSLTDDSVVDVSGGGIAPGDLEGVFGQNSDFNNDFFGISDSDEFGAAQTASWTFNVAGFENLELRIGMGGISDGNSFGGFDPQTATFTVSLDGGATQRAFALASTTTVGGFTFRPMDSGTLTPVGGVLQATGDNAVTKLLAEDGSAAGDTFLNKTPAAGPGAGQLDTFSTAINGTGSLLTLTFNTDFPFEAFAFDNIQIFGAPAAIVGTELRILDVTLAEGDAGTTNFEVVVVRAGDTTVATDVDFAIAAGTADAADFVGGTLPVGGTLNFAANQTFQIITIPVQSDLDTEADETFTVTLSNATGGATIATPTATVTIQNDDFAPTAIYDIQGAAQTSALVGTAVSTTGIVTAVDSNGFYLQDPVGDGNDDTSDGIFVFTSTAPTVAVGDNVTVTGTVSEFTPGGAATRNLSTTQISGNPSIVINSNGNPLPAAIVIGAGGRSIPSSTAIDNDGLTTYEPGDDPIDFFESLEGMRVTAANLRAVSGLNRFGEVFGVVDNGAGATGLSQRGTLNISPNDFNPERVQIQQDPNVTPFVFPAINTGDLLGDVTGVLGYDFGNFEILVTEDFTANITPAGLTPETTLLTSSATELTVASYNVLNLDPNDNPGEGQADQDIANGRFDAIAAQIVNNLQAPDIIGLQEIQDNTGGTDDGVTAADVTLQTLVDAIAAAGGPTYQFIDNTFITNNASGGQPGANIRTAFLYNPARVTLDPASVQTIGGQGAGESFEGARLPLVATFQFDGQDITVVNNHFSSKGGSSAILGLDQPFEGRQEDLKNADYLAANPGLDAADTFVNGSLNERRIQAQAVNNFVDGLLTADPNANLIVLGDLNEFEFVSPVNILKGTQESNADGTAVTDTGAAPILQNLTDRLAPNERYTFNFQGNSQSLDHILVSNNLLPRNTGFDIVNVNSEFNETNQRASDHDPLVARFRTQSLVNGVASGDVDQDSAILWARSTFLGLVAFEYSTDQNFGTIAGSTTATVTDINQPVKVEIDGLTPGTEYFYRVTDAAGATVIGRFVTAAATGKNGLSFGVTGDWRGELSPYPAVSNADEANLDFFVLHGDTIYADFPSPALLNPDGSEKPQAETLEDFRAKYAEVYGQRFGLNTWGDLRASTSIFATIDDHEVINDFAGGATIASDDDGPGGTSRFLNAFPGDDPTALQNDSTLFENGLQAFQEYNPIRDEFYGNTGDDRTANERKLYRTRTYGQDAATFVLDTRSFRDQPLAAPDITNPADIGQFLVDSLDPSRQFLGDAQLNDLKADLLAAQQSGVTWKFIMVPEPIQELGLYNVDAFEGYAAERNEILKFIEDNEIDNVVFVAADIHGTIVNNLTYTETVGGPRVATDVWEITTGSVAFNQPFGQTVIEVAAGLGLIDPATRAFYDSLPIAPDADSIPNDKDDFLEQAFQDLAIGPGGYDPIGLDNNLTTNVLGSFDVEAQLLVGDYVVAHTYGWTQFDIDPDTQVLTVSTYGILPYSRAELEDPATQAGILARQPQLLSQFVVNPTLDQPEFGFDLTNSDIENGTIALLSSNLTLSFSITTLATSFVNELVIFKVEDSSGSVRDEDGNLVSPDDEAAYIQAILNSEETQIVLSSLDSTDDLPDDFLDELSGLGGAVDFAGGSRFGFLLAIDATLEEIEANPFGELFFLSTQGEAEILELSTGSFTLAFGDDGGFDDLILTVEAEAQDDLINEADEFPTIARNLRINDELVEVIDLANLQFDFNNDGTADNIAGQGVNIEATLYREAAFNNTIGFYVADANGAINGIAPTAANRQAYAAAAFSSRVGEVSAPSNESTANTTFSFEGGQLLLPFIISNAATPNANFSNIYFPFLDLNADGADHIRLLGNGIFGFEDLAGGGDQDFDDVIVQVTAASLA